MNKCCLVLILISYNETACETVQKILSKNKIYKHAFLFALFFKYNYDIYKYPAARHEFFVIFSLSLCSPAWQIVVISPHSSSVLHGSLQILHFSNFLRDIYITNISELQLIFFVLHAQLFIFIENTRKGYLPEMDCLLCYKILRN